VNLPLSAAILLLGPRIVVRARADERLPDLLGSAMLALGLGLLTLGIVEGNDWGWGSLAAVGTLAAGLLLLAGVLARSYRHPRPLLEPELLRLASFRRGNVGTLLFSAAFFSLILGNVLFLTGVWRYSLLRAGLATLPGPLFSTIVAGPAGRLADRFGHRAVVVPGTVVFAAGVMVLRSAGAQPDWLGLWLPGACLTGIGIGLAFPTLGSAAVRDVPDDRFATASAVNAAFRQVGAVLGTAILVAIVGEPASLAEAMRVADQSYLFAALVALAAGVVALTLGRGAPIPEPVPVATGAPAQSRMSAATS
jgi:NTE family protein